MREQRVKETEVQAVPFTVGGGQKVEDFRLDSKDSMGAIMQVVREAIYNGRRVMEGAATVKVSFRVEEDGHARALGVDVQAIEAQEVVTA